MSYYKVHASSSPPFFPLLLLFRLLLSKNRLFPSSFNLASSARFSSTCGINAMARKNASAARLAPMMKTMRNPRWYAGISTVRIAVASSGGSVER